MAEVSGRGNRQLNISRSRTANAGFSLVELLIAVTIMAIIVIPLLHMFVTSTRINVKSRQTLRATTVAQDIMEGLKAYSLEEVQTQFSLPDGSYSSDFFYPTEGFYIVNSSMIQGGVREIRELETGRNPDGSFVDKDEKDNEIYYFGIENLKMQGGEYDALIKLDASTYGAKSKERVDEEGGTPVAGAHEKDFNGRYYADVTSVSETAGAGSANDSSYHENANQNADLLRYVKNQIKDDSATTSEDLAALDAVTELSFFSPPEAKADEVTLRSREIMVVLEEAKDPSGVPAKDAGGNPQCKASVKFKYVCEFRGRTYISYYGLNGFVDDVAYDNVVGIPRTFTSGNFYLFYYPIYKAGSEIDNIVFNIESTDIPVLFDKDQPLLKSITLAKQVRSTVDTDANLIIPDMSDNKLFDEESIYCANISISENPLGSDIDLTFRSNVGINISKKAREFDDPNDAILHGVHWDYDLEAINFVEMVNGEVGSKTTNVIYDIEITVYKAGAAKHFGDPGFGEVGYSDEEVVRLATINNLNY